MTTRHREVNRIILLGLLDIALTLLALYLASWARYLLPWGMRLPWRLTTLPWQVYLITAAIWPIVLSLASVYDISPHSNRQLYAEIWTLLLGVSIACLVLAGALYLSYRQVPRRLFLYFGVIDVCLLTLSRILTHLPFCLAHRNNHAPSLLVVGTGRVGEEIACQIQRLGKGWQVVGFLDNDPARVGKQIAGVPVLGTLDALEEVIKTKKVDEVIFALPSWCQGQLEKMVISLEKFPVEVSIVPDYFELALFRVRMDESLGFPLIRLRASAIEGGKRVIKRLFDLVLSIPLLVICLPVFPLVALLIKLDSPGPALIRQERVGENCQVFGMWKFRTMVQNADSLLREVMRQTPDGQLVHKRPDDPRVTRVGRFLRRYSIDELPQLINVIKGEMSLVGPRPELVWLADRYEGWQRKRFAVPPGMTGWWQISGRSERPMHLHVEDDLYYINNYSIWLDLYILWRTIGAVISGKGAY